MAALFPTTKWDNIENKPSTFEPTVGDVSGTAYDGAKGKSVKDVLDKVVAGTIIVPKASSVFSSGHGFAPSLLDGGIVAWNVDSSLNLPVANSVRIGGAMVYAYTITVNPGGADSMLLPLPHGYKGSMIYLSVMNTNAYSNRTTVTSVSMGQAGQVGVVVVLNGTLTYNIQLSVLVISV